MGHSGQDYPGRATGTNVSAAQSWLKLRGFGTQLEPLHGEDSNPAQGVHKDCRGPLHVRTAATIISPCVGAKNTSPGIPEQGRAYSLT